jgi:hypothetical protein
MKREGYLLRDVVVVSKLPSPHGASTDVSDFAHLNKVMQRLHGLLRIHVLEISTVDLKKIDVWGIETFERGFNLVEDRLTRETGLIDVFLRIAKSWLEEGPDADVVRDKTMALG